jgi:hypothetical protein
MARRTAALKPQLNQIRTWAREGRTDAWIAYQLGTTSATVQEFRFEYGLDKGPGNPVEEPVTPEHVVQTISFDSPPPLPPLERSAPADESSEAAEPIPSRRQRRSRPVKADEEALKVEVASEAGIEIEAPVDGEGEGDRPKRRRRRGGRGGGATAAADASTPIEDARPEQAATTERSPAAARRKPRTPPSYQGSVVAGAVLVLDPAVTRSAAWRAHWSDSPAFDVVVEDDQIVLRRRSAG